MIPELEIRKKRFGPRNGPGRPPRVAAQGFNCPSSITPSSMTQMMDQFNITLSNKIHEVRSAFEDRMSHYFQTQKKSIQGTLNDISQLPKQQQSGAIQREYARFKDLLNNLNLTLQEISNLQLDQHDDNDMLNLAENPRPSEQVQDEQIRQINQYRFTKHQGQPAKLCIRCPVCNAEFPTLGALDKHIQANHNVEVEDYFVCDECQKSYSDPKHLSTHIYYTHAQRQVYMQYQCKCKKYMDQRQDITRHVMECVNYSGLVRRCLEQSGGCAHPKPQRKFPTTYSLPTNNEEEMEDQFHREKEGLLKYDKSILPQKNNKYWLRQEQEQEEVWMSDEEEQGIDMRNHQWFDDDHDK